MKPRQLRLTHAGAPGAGAALARHAGELDLALHAFGEDSILMPPALWQALEERLGPTRLTALLSAAGLQDLGPLDRADMARRGFGLAAAGSEALGLLAAGWSWLDSLLPQPAPDWHLDCCRVREAWQALGTPPDRPVIDWQGLRAGHIDTGYTGHPVFGFPQGSWIDEAAARSFDAGQVTVGARDAMRGIAAGHGTTSGSLLCGADLGPALYHGTAPRLPLVPVHVDDCYILDKRAGEFEAAVHYLVDEARVPLINVSMGTFLKRSAPPPIQRAVDHCYERGVLLIAAAGNVPLPDWPAFPAALPRAIAIAGITSSLQPWGLSSSGDWVDFSAPARQVRRALARQDETAPDGLSYGYTADLGGTTFATAMVSGAAALWLLRHRSAIASRYGEPWQVVEAFRAMASRTATIPAGWSGTAGFGAGILNARDMMDANRLPAASELQRR